MLEEVLSQYPIRPIRTTRISMGLINKTYKVEAVEGLFILQKLNKIYDGRTTANIALVGEFLNKNGLTAQTVILDKSGALLILLGEYRWRLLSLVPGKVIERIDCPETAYEASKLLGQFHKTMKRFVGFLYPTTRVHDTQSHWNKFLKVLPEKLDSELEDLVKVITKVPSLFLPANLIKSVTHGDPKISNFVFEEYSGKGVALIDLDGCSIQNNTVVELGDAFRSWCGRLEDENNNSFDLEKFKAGWSGYLETTDKNLLQTERLLVPQAIKLITLELASRFLRDYWEDKYFGWDANRYPSRKAHNLARARGQVSLYLDFLQKESRITEIIKT